MTTRKGVVTMKGNPVSLAGNELRVGQPAPDFEVLDNGLKPVKFSSYKGKVCVISSLPSLDTPVCDMETRKFNQMAAKLSSDVSILTISMDLPFAQKRWCGSAGVDKVVTLSDHRQAEFGNAYGVLIPELRLLARAVFVVDKKGVIQHIQLVREIAEEPDYDSVLQALKKLI
jgi:thiol peroxidase